MIMDDVIVNAFKELPFYNVSHVIFLDEITSDKKKFYGLLEENCFTKLLEKCITKETGNAINCKYYDIEDLNVCTKNDSEHIYLSMLHVNIQSSFKNFGVLKAHLSLLNFEFDIIAISEAGKNNHNLAHVFGNDYSYFYKAPYSSKGGVACYINNKLNPVVRQDLNFEKDPRLENLWLEMCIDNRKCVLGIIYRHPGYNTNAICKGLEQILSRIIDEDKLCLVCGDLNIDLLKPENCQTKLYIDTVLGLDSIPLITLPTRITSHSATLIDHINISGLDKILNKDISVGNLFIEIADHLPNFVVIKDRSRIADNERHKTRIFSNRNILRFRAQLEELNWEDVCSSTDADECYNIFIDRYCHAYNAAFPLVRVSRKRNKDKRWLTKGLKVSIRHKNRLYRKYIRKPNEINRAVYRKYKNKVTALVHICEKNYYRDLMLENKKNIRGIWKIYSNLMNKTKSHDGRIDTLNVHNKILCENGEIAREFNIFFSSIGENMANKFPADNQYSRYLKNHCSNNFFLTPTTEDEVYNEIHKMPTKKSSGLDNISMNILKLTVDIIKKPLTHVYNSSFSTSVVPDKLKVAKVIPIYKKGNADEPSNYRPISLLSTFNKVMEKLVYNRLYSFLTNNDILYKYQFGFRRGYSTTLAIAEIIDNIRMEVDQGNSVIGVYLDLSKAFDCVNHEILLHKLNYYGVRGHSLSWFSSYLSNRKQVTFVNKTLSHMVNVNVGVPQGSVLGPLLFILYVNDIGECSNDALIRLFADDTNVFVSHKNLEVLKEKAEHTLADLIVWFSANKLTLNINKTCFNVYSNKKHNIVELNLDGKKIVRSEVTKYLGMILDEKLQWSAHVDGICHKLTKLLHAFRTVSKFTDYEMACQLYYAYVYPYITYGIEIYGTSGNCNTNRIQILQNRILKTLTRKECRFSTMMLHDELGLLTVKNIYLLYLNSFVFKQRNGLLPTVFEDYFHMNIQARSRTTRQDSNLYVSRRKTTFGSKALKVTGAKLWNSTPKEFTTITSLKAFKKMYKKYLMELQSKGNL